MLGVYEFEFHSEGDIIAVYPFDFEGATCGADYADAARMAADWLKGELEHRLMVNQPWPEATLGHEPEHAGGRVAIVAVDVDLDHVETVSATCAAELLGVSKSRVSHMLRDGLLEGYRKGRTTFVTMDSINTRMAEKHPAGRPRKMSPHENACPDSTSGFARISEQQGEPSPHH